MRVGLALLLHATSVAYAADPKAPPPTAGKAGAATATASGQSPAGTDAGGEGVVGSAVDKVLAYYHTEEFLDQTMSQVEQAAVRRKREEPGIDNKLDAILQVARKIYRGKNLLPVFRAAYLKAMRLEYFNSLKLWQNSPIGIAFRRGWDAAATAEYAAMQQYVEKEATGVLRPNRRNALTTLVTVSEQDKLLTSMMLGADFAVFTGLEVQKPRAQRERQRVLRDKIKARKTGYNEPGRIAAYAHMAYVCRELKNEEIDEVARFYTTASGQAVTRAYNKAAEQTMEQAGLTLGAHMDKM